MRVLQTPHYSAALGEVDLDIVSLEFVGVDNAALDIAPLGQRSWTIGGFRHHDTSLGPSVLDSECYDPSSDSCVLDIAEVTGRYDYVNRTAHGLGVEPGAWIPG